MKYSRFEELPVWQTAIDFALKVFEFTEKCEKLFRGLGDTKNQLERAAISIIKGAKFLTEKERRLYLQRKESTPDRNKSEI